MKKSHPSKQKKTIVSFRPDKDVLAMLVGNLPAHYNRSALINQCIRERLPSKLFVTK